jgi:hypothetical protein
MLAEKEFLVNNPVTRNFISKAGSTTKEVIEFKDTYHELQKEPNKDEIMAKTLEFLLPLLKDKYALKPFGVLDEKTLRFGHLRIRKSGSRLKHLLKVIVAAAIYIGIGLL